MKSRVKQEGCDLQTVLAKKVGKECFDVWFSSSVELEIEEDQLVISVGSPFIRERLRRSFRDELIAVSKEVSGKELGLEFRLVESLSSALPLTSTATVGAASGTIVGTTTGAVLSSAQAAQQKSTIVSTATPKSLFQPRRKFSTLENFIMGPSNQMAGKSARMVVDNPGSLCPFFVHGPVGVGKTHLLEGIWSGFKRRHRSAKTLYLSAEQFTSEFVGCVRNGLPSFRRKYRSLDLLILDGVHFFQGKQATLVELLHTIDNLMSQGKQVVLSADRPPLQLDALGPELTTRLASGLVCTVEPPDYETRLLIIQLILQQIGFQLAPNVCEFIAGNFSSNVCELKGAINRLKVQCESTNIPITLHLAETVLADLIQQRAKPVGLKEIEDAVCQLFLVESEQLHSKRRAQRVSYPRMLAMWLARKHTRAACSEIGDFFDRCHSTVVAAEKKVNGWVGDQSTIKIGDRQLHVHEAIRMVEKKLEVG